MNHQLALMISCFQAHSSKLEIRTTYTFDTTKCSSGQNNIVENSKDRYCPKNHLVNRTHHPDLLCESVKSLISASLCSISACIRPN